MSDNRGKSSLRWMLFTSIVGGLVVAGIVALIALFMEEDPEDILIVAGLFGALVAFGFLYDQAKSEGLRSPFGWIIRIVGSLFGGAAAGAGTGIDEVLESGLFKAVAAIVIFGSAFIGLAVAGVIGLLIAAIVAAVFVSLVGAIVGAAIGSVVGSAVGVGKEVHELLEDDEDVQDSLPPMEIEGSSAGNESNLDHDKWVLVGTKGPLNGKTIPIDERGIVIGRDPMSCSLILPEDLPGLSRRHVEVRLGAHGGRVEVRDCGSKHGTLVDGLRLSSNEWRTLERGSEISLASDRARFRLASFN